MNLTFTHSIPSTMLAGAIALGVSSFGDFPRAAQAQVDPGATAPQASAPQTAATMPALQPGTVILPPPNVDDLELNVTPRTPGIVLKDAPATAPTGPVRTAVRTLSPGRRPGISSPLANPRPAAGISPQGSQIPYLIEFGQPLPGITPPVWGNAQTLRSAAPSVVPPSVVPFGVVPLSTPLMPTAPLPTAPLATAPLTTKPLNEPLNEPLSEPLSTEQRAILLPVTPAPEESDLSSLESLPNVQPLAVPAMPLPPQSSSPALGIPAPRF